MIRQHLLVCSVLFLATFLGVARCAEVAAPAPNFAITEQPIMLDKALAGAEAAQGELYICVGAEQTPLPPGATTPEAGDTVTSTAEAYGRIVVSFDDIEAIAPATRTVLNTDPPAPNPYDGMPPTDAFKLLSASLTKDEWADLIGNRGLVYGDLTTDEQRSLFGATFPVTPLHLYPVMPLGANSTQSDTPPIVTAEALKTAHLRLGQRYQLGIPVIGKNEWLDTSLDNDDTSVRYFAEPGNARAQVSVYGATLKATVPNTVKDSDFDYQSSALKKWVKLNNVKTVGQLVTDIGLATHVEIYADPHYEKRSVTLLGSAPALASNLLQALALCVAGTYRQVGSAYVLTDDLTGVGVRRSIINSFTRQADADRQATVDKAGDSLFTVKHGMDELPFLSGDTVLSEAERTMTQAQKSGFGIVPGQAMDIEPAFSDLTPAQRDIASKFKSNWESQPGADQPDREQLTLDGKMILSTVPELDMEVDGVSGIVDLSNYINVYALYQPSQTLRSQVVQKTSEADPVAGDRPKPPDVTLQSLSIKLKAIAGRAVLVSPKSPGDVDSIIASMKVLGLNQLWLNVFSGGASHLDSPAQGDKTDTLNEAITKTRGSGITVIPLIDELNWSLDAPQDAIDLTMTGQTSAQAENEQTDYMVVMGYMQFAAGTAAPRADATYVSPIARTTRNALNAIVKKVASTPGVGGIALRGTLSNGYDNGDQYTLGYTEAMRLAFLRSSHEDPIDLDPERYGGSVNPDTSLPDYDDWQTTTLVQKEWNAFRSQANRGLLAELWQTAQRAGRATGIPLWIQSRGQNYGTEWYGMWAGPGTPLPSVPASLISQGVGPDTDMAQIARATCRTNMVEIAGWRLGSPGSFSDGLDAVKVGWSGFVIDASQSSGDPLAGLVKALTPGAPVKRNSSK